MKFIIYWLSLVLLFGFCWSEDSTKTEHCKCVPYFMCQSNTIVGDGANLINIRPHYRRPHKRSADSTIDSFEDLVRCESYLEVCCSLPKESSSEDDVKLANNPMTERKKCTQPKHQSVGSDTTPSKSNEFPWTVAILKKKNKIDTIDESDISYQCGGTLIHPQIVLTAAHCINDENPSYLQVHAGKWSSEKNGSQPFQKRQVQNVICHEDFDKHNLHNDFGLLILNEPVDLTDVNVNIIYLAETNENFDRSLCIANGWGKKVLTKKDERALKRIELPVVPNNQCQNNLKTTLLGEYFQLHNSFICAGGKLGTDTCEYDGGHPLVCPMKDNAQKYVQAGIVAWGIDCGEDGLPGVYANVAYARNWINEKITKAGYNLNEYQCTV